MLLTMDVGNTNTVLGVFREKELLANWRLTTSREQTIDEYGILARDLFTLAAIDPHEIDGVIISSVVPPLNSTLAGMSERYFNLPALFVEPGIKTGMPIHYDNPLEVGADRIVNSVAAFEKYGGPCSSGRFRHRAKFRCRLRTRRISRRRPLPRNRNLRRRPVQSRRPPFPNRNQRSWKNHRHEYRRVHASRPLLRIHRHGRRHPRSHKKSSRPKNKSGSYRRPSLANRQRLAPHRSHR